METGEQETSLRKHIYRLQSRSSCHVVDAAEARGCLCLAVPPSMGVFPLLPGQLG